MLVKKKMKGPRKAVLSVVMVLIVGAIGYLIYTNFLVDKKTVSSKKVGVEVDLLVVPSLSPTFHDDFLSKLPYIDFEEYGRLPVIVDRMGRSNPFSEL